MKKLTSKKAIVNAIQSSFSKTGNMRVFPQEEETVKMKKSASKTIDFDKEAIDKQTGFDKTASIQKTANFEMGNVNTMFYPPRLTPDTWYLPRSRKMLLKWVDIFFDWDPYIYSILMMHSRYPIGNFNLICDEKEEQFFNEVLHNEQWDILDVLREGSISFTKFGEAICIGSWNSALGIWEGFSWIDPGLIEVKEVPFTGKIKIFLEIPSKYKRAITGKSAADEIERALIPQFIVDAVKKGLKYIELDNEETTDEQGRYSPPKVCMMVNKTNVGEKGLRGLPPMTPAIKCVAGDTKIALLDGSTPTVKELYDKNVQNIELYNIDENNNIVPGKAEKIIKTTIEKGLKITFDNGESITVTKDHPLMTRNGNYIQAQNLKINDEMMSLKTTHKITAIEEVGETQFYGVQNAAPYFNFAIAFEDGSGIFSKNTLVYSDYLRKAQMARAQRFAYPVEIWRFGDIQNGYIPNDEELSSVREMLQKALTNPPYTIVYTPLLSLEVVSPAGGLLPIYDDYNFVENQVLVALGTNKNIVLGEGGWMSNAKTLSMQRLIMDYQIVRDMWTRTFLQNFVLRPMCIANGFTKKSLVDKTKDIANVPKIAWVNSLDVQNEEDRKKLYIDLWDKGLISSKTLYSQFPDLDFKTETTQMQEEKGTVLDGTGRTLPATVKDIENEEKETEVKTSADEVNEKPIKPIKMDI